MEQLEGRRLLHAGHDHSVDEHAGHDHEQPVLYESPLTATNLSAGHVSESAFRAAFPQFANVANLWDPNVFNPENSPNRADWLFDPHGIEAETNPVLPDAPMFSSPEAVQLPDLVPLTAGADLDPFLDTTEIPGHNLLRFTTAVGNAGTGPAILVSANGGSVPAGSGITSWINTDGTQNVLQQKFNWTGSSFAFDSYRPAGRMVWHNGHGHFHLEGYATYRLLTNVGGQPGPVALRSGFDNAPAIGDKVGFCLINIRPSFTIPGTGSSSNQLQGFNASGQPNTSCGFTQGIHVGKADVYSSIYDGQWIDVTGVPNGSYFLEVTLDSMNVIEESDEVNNTVIVPLTLNAANQTGGTLQPDRFEPNNTFAEATDLEVLGVQTQPGLTAHISGESDFFKFTAASTGSYSVQLVVADKDVNLFVYDSNETLLGSSSNPGSGTSLNPITETVNVNFVAGQTYYVKAQAFGSDLTPVTSAVSSNFALKVNVNPTVQASAPAPSAGELGLTSGHVLIARNGPTSSPLLVNLNIAGTATRDVDYAIYFDGVPVAGDSITIGNESSAADLEIRPLTDTELEANESVIITVTGGSAYVVGAGSGTVTLFDVPPQVTATAFEFETAPLGLSFDFTLDVSASLDVADLEVVNLGSSDVVAPVDVEYLPASNRGTFNLPAGVPDGNYRATLGARDVTHAMGVRLASDEVVDFFVFAGDANRDRTIDIGDFAVLATNFNQPGAFSLGDFNYNNEVEIGDFAMLASKFNTSLPLARRAPAAAPVAALARSSIPVRAFSPVGAGFSRELIASQDTLRDLTML